MYVKAMLEIGADPKLHMPNAKATATQDWPSCRAYPAYVVSKVYPTRKE